MIGVFHRVKYSELVNPERQAASVFSLGTGHCQPDLPYAISSYSPTEGSFREAPIGSTIMLFFTVYEVFSYESDSSVDWLVMT